MRTHFASPERSDQNQLSGEIAMIAQNPIIDGLMNAVSGLFAVLNHHRQILTLNKAFMESIGVEDINEIIGLRPGESLNCVHASEMRGGCGTSPFCSTCGAVIAIVLGLNNSEPSERICSIEVERDGIKEDLSFKVKVFPIQLKDSPIILLFLQDVTQYQKLASLERVFFHDINNIVSGLKNSCQQLLHGSERIKPRAAERVDTLSNRLASEIAIQSQLVQSGISKYTPSFEPFESGILWHELQSAIDSHPIARGKRVEYPMATCQTIIRSDISLLLRVLTNMVINALEASSEGECIQINLEKNTRGVTISVQNEAMIPPNHQTRIFQKNFSTKSEFGRGLGTYSMKLIGEQYLAGEVSFSSNEKEGTTFWLSLPDN